MTEFKARLQKICELLKTKVKVNENKSETHVWTKYVRNEKETTWPLLTIDAIQNTTVDMEDDMNMSVSFGEKSLSDGKCGERMEPINFLDNCSRSYFSWCGFDFDLYTLDIYL